VVPVAVRDDGTAWPVRLDIRSMKSIKAANNIRFFAQIVCPSIHPETVDEG
jgi:hypothetical protein